MALRLKSLQFFITTQIRHSSSSSASSAVISKEFDRKQHYVVACNHDQTILFWHPEKEFPYECTRPLPEKITKPHPHLAIEPSILKIFHQQSELSVIQKLTEATFTTKHKWFPHNKIRFRKNTKPDRPYL